MVKSKKIGSYLRAALYLRSCKNETGKNACSIKTQKSKLIAFCKKQGWQIHGIFIDAGYPAGTLNRPGLKELIQKIKTKKINIVLVYAIDRLSRSLPDFLCLMDELTKHSILLRTCIKPLTTKRALDLWHDPVMNKLLTNYKDSLIKHRNKE